MPAIRGNAFLDAVLAETPTAADAHFAAAAAAGALFLPLVVVQVVGVGFGNRLQVTCFALKSRDVEDRIGSDRISIW